MKVSLNAQANIVTFIFVMLSMILSGWVFIFLSRLINELYLSKYVPNPDSLTNPGLAYLFGWLDSALAIFIGGLVGGYMRKANPWILLLPILPVIGFAWMVNRIVFFSQMIIFVSVVFISAWELGCFFGAWIRKRKQEKAST